jgi:hypothetical protein
MQEPDLLVREPRPPRHPRLLRVLVLVLVVTTLLGATAVWLTGRYRAPEETAALQRCAARAETAVHLAETRLGSMVRYVLPALGTVSHELDTDLYGLIRTQAVGLDRPVTEALDRCRAVELWPAGRERRAARAAYVAFLEAEVARLRAIADDGRAYYEDEDYDEVRRLRQEAQQALTGL